MGKSTIQWTDYTFNPWIGCRKVAPECANCYAETLDRNRYSKTLTPGTKDNPVSHWGSGPRHRTKTWGDPIKWNRKAEEDVGAPECPRVFCASLADWLDDENVPIEWLADLLKLIHDTPHLDWLLLTKRPQNWRQRMEAVQAHAIDAVKGHPPYGAAHDFAMLWCRGEARANVWIGVSAGADQAAALDIPSRIHFLSCEPMLRPLDMTHAAQFDWIIFGGESGKNARECNVNWIRDGVTFCKDTGIACFVKQLGARPVESAMGDLHPLKDSHGGDVTEWPEDLRVREFPKRPWLL